MTESGVSIIIPTFNGIQHLERLLATFFKINTYQPFEFIFIDHTSTGSAAQVVSEYIPRPFIRLINPSRNQSFSAACNLGASKARYPYLLFLDVGIVYTSDVLPTALAKLADPAIGVVGVRLDDDPTVLQPGGEPGVQHLGIEFVWNGEREHHQPRQIRQPSVQVYLSTQTLNETNDAVQGAFRPAVTGAFFLCRKADFERLSGFLTEYDYGLGDVDFCLRVGRDLNKRVWCVTGLGLQHSERITREPNKKLRDEHIARNHEYFRAAWGERTRDFSTIGNNSATVRAQSPSTVLTTVLPSKHNKPSIKAPQVAPEDVMSAWQILEESKVGTFSIILPTWNRRGSIPRSIESVLAQFYKDWELIICDDGSDDETEAFVRECYASEIAIGRIIFLSLEHKGVSAARNAGLRTARGDWIAYLDSDNSWSPYYLLITAAGYAREKHRRTAYGGLCVYDEARNREFVRCQEFNWGLLLKQNFIDLNIFSHHRWIYEQLGGFDESLTRLVDWDLILRYTKLYEPIFNKLLLADYYIAHSLHNITLTKPLKSNEVAVRRKYAADAARFGLTPLRIAYVLWDWPALSQTFVLEEIRELLKRGVDIRVYFVVRPDKAAEIIPDIIAQHVSNVDDLAVMLVRDERNWIHSHFTYPAVAKLAWPAAEKTGIAFSFMPHAVDIFHHTNRERNRLAEVTQSSLCARVIVHGEYHRRFLIHHGVPPQKVIMSPQAVDLSPIRVERISVRNRRGSDPLRILTIARFIEKKGIEDLISSVALLKPDLLKVRIIGYGPLEYAYRELINRHGLHSTVLLEGSFEGTEALRAALNWADVFCLPCVEAENGDVDGMPTVFFEAMAAGVPCVAGSVSAIPDFIVDGINGFLVPPRNPTKLAEIFKRIAEMPRATLAALAETARDWVDEHIGSAYTVDVLLDVCARPPVDVFMVTYHRDGHGDWAATKRAVSSVLDRTMTPMVLTVIDNGSEKTALDGLRKIARGDDRVRLIELGENRFCGPASNIALDLAKSDFVFYVCSNEGYAARNGWERTCLRFMRRRPKVAMGGHLISSPAWPDGDGYKHQHWFSNFRNRDFVESNLSRCFFHIQGGLWVMRRSVYVAEGGFNNELVQAQMDVEYSYYLESKGYELGDIPGFVVLSNKTRPSVEAFLDEFVLAVHPVFNDTCEIVDTCVRGDKCRCNICGWFGHAQRSIDAVGYICPKCNSMPRDRAAFRWLAGSNFHHRNKSLNCQGFSQSLRRAVNKMFRVVDGEAEVEIPQRIPGLPSRVLGISPISLRKKDSMTARIDSNFSIQPTCNICGSTNFGLGPGGRLSADTNMLPRCEKCQSLERHRAFRSALEALRSDAFSLLRALQFSEDRAVNPTWFSSHEVSIWNGVNSLDLQSIDRPDESYDIVICNHVIEHVADDRSAVRELFRILRPKGFIFLSFPDPLRLGQTRDWGFPDKRQHGHYRVYGRDVFKWLASTLPTAVIECAIARDPVTEKKEMFFLIGKDAKYIESITSQLIEREMVHRPKNEDWLNSAIHLKSQIFNGDLEKYPSVGTDKVSHVEINRRIYKSNPFFIGLPNHIDTSSGALVKDILRKAGLNTGNLLFTRALHRVLGGNCLGTIDDFDPKRVSEQHDCLIIPAANWLSPRTDLKNIAEFVEATDLPCYIVGLGAQAPNEKGFPAVKPGTLRLIQIAADRSHTISVRGTFSAEVLSHYGIKNVTITGCPSILWHVDRPCQVQQWQSTPTRIAMNCSRGIPSERVFIDKTETARLNLLLPRLARSRGYDFIFQAELPEIYYVLRKDIEVQKMTLPNNYLRRVYADEDESAVCAWLRDRGKVFFDLESWLAYLESVDFVIGSRLHGAIAALLAGTPAVLITHDSRTSETARQMGIPSVNSLAINENLDPLSLYASADFDLFNQCSALNYQNFADFFESNELQHKLVLNREQGIS